MLQNMLKFCVFLGILLLAHAVQQARKRRPLIVTTDSDVDDLLALAYLAHQDAFELQAVIVDGNGWSNSIAGVPNVATTLAVAGCKTLPIAYAGELSSFYIGKPLPDLTSINQYIWNCLGTNLTDEVRPAVPEGARLIVSILQRAKEPVDLMVLGTWTHIAAAFQLDPSVARKVGTVWASGGYFNYTNPIPDAHFPFTAKNKGTSWYFFLDPVAVHRVLSSGIRNYVFMASSTTNTLINNAEDNNEMVISLGGSPDDFFVRMQNNFASCTNQSESNIQWWDETVPVMAVSSVLGAGTPNICQSFQNYKVSINMHDSKRFGAFYNDPVRGVEVKVCTSADYNLLLQQYWGALYTQPASCPVTRNPIYFDAAVDAVTNAATLGGSNDTTWSAGMVAFVAVASVAIGLLAIGQVTTCYMLRRAQQDTSCMAAQDMEHISVHHSGLGIAPQGTPAECC